jgi:single-strand DNA-binding protein
MLNKVFIIGKVNRDPDVKQTNAGEVVTFLIPTTRYWKDQKGDKHEETEWHSIVVFGKQARTAAEYLKKGTLVHVEGRLKTRSWEDANTGEKRYKTEIVCETFKMLSPKEQKDTTAKEKVEEEDLLDYFDV